jgi:hypothetical protein
MNVLEIGWHKTFIPGGGVKAAVWTSGGLYPPVLRARGCDGARALRHGRQQGGFTETSDAQQVP